MKLTESRALSRTAAYCSKAERCEYDVRKKLLLWESPEEEQIRIIAKLKKENFLNEERFTQSFIRDKVRFNKWGKAKIAFELTKKRIPRDIIQKYVADIDEQEVNDSLRKILETKIKSVKANNDYKKRVKLMRFALGRGFSSEQIAPILNNLIGNNDEDDY